MTILKHTLVSAVALAALAGCSSPPPAEPMQQPGGSQVLVEPAAGQPRLLLFSRTAAFRHDAIPAGIQAFTQLATQQGLGLTATEDGAELTDDKLAGFGAVVFLNTTGDALTAEQQAAFERYIRAGHGYIGIHAAADCEYDWPWYGSLVGAYFMGHSDVVMASVEVEPVQHAAVTGLASPWQRRDEWYGFRTNPRAQVQVLLTVDETTFDPGPGMMGADHPIAWSHEYDGGRAFYTGLGHTAESYSDPAFLAHVKGGIDWALRR